MSVDKEVLCSWENTRAEGGVTVVRRCDSHQGGVTGFRKVRQLMESCVSHGEDVKVFGEVQQLSESVTVIREVRMVLESYVS